MNTQPYIPLSLGDQIKAAKAAYKELRYKNDYMIGIQPQHAEDHFIRQWLEKEYIKLEQYTKALMEEMQD